MSANGDSSRIQVEWDWFRFGLFLAFVYATFTALVFVLLRIDQSIAFVVAIVGGILFAAGIMMYVFYLTDRPQERTDSRN